MNVWLMAATVLLLAFIPLLFICFRRESAQRLVGLEFASCLVVIELILICEGYGRPSFFDLPLTLTFLSFGGGMVFTRFIQRWL